MKRHDSLSTSPIAAEQIDALADQMVEALERLPLSPFLRTWNRLIWWISVWPVFRHLATIELSLPETFVLQMLMLKPLNVTQVAELLGLQHSSASRAIDRLVADAFVSREEDPEDRRQKRLELTEAGTAKVHEIDAIFGAEFSALAAGLSRDEQQTLQQLLSGLVASSVADPEAPPERIVWARAFLAASADVHHQTLDTSEIADDG